MRFAAERTTAKRYEIRAYYLGVDVATGLFDIGRKQQIIYSAYDDNNVMPIVAV